MSSSLCCNLDVTTCKYSFSILLMLCLICPCPVPYIRYAVPHIPYMSQGAMNLTFCKAKYWFKSKYHACSCEDISHNIVGISSYNTIEQALLLMLSRSFLFRNSFQEVLIGY